MSAKYRIALWLLITLLVCIGFAISGGSEPAARLLHKWFYGVSMVFLLLFVTSVTVVLRGPLMRSIWVIPITATLGYLAGTTAYIAYFATFEPRLFFNTLTHTQLLDLASTLFLFGPMVSLTWLFGAFAGVLFLALDCVLRMADADTLTR